jgi:hypothetical protein
MNNPNLGKILFLGIKKPIKTGFLCGFYVVCSVVYLSNLFDLMKFKTKN